MEKDEESSSSSSESHWLYIPLIKHDNPCHSVTIRLLPPDGVFISGKYGYERITTDEKGRFCFPKVTTQKRRDEESSKSYEPQAMCRSYYGSSSSSRGREQHKADVSGARRGRKYRKVVVDNP